MGLCPFLRENDNEKKTKEKKRIYANDQCLQLTDLATRNFGWLRQF